MFSNSRNINISGNSRFIYNDSKYISSSELLDDGIRILVSRVVTGAMHNSGERFDAPTCHEETRTAIQDDILGWADELVDKLNEIVTWLYGPAGSGKSAIAQSIALKLHARDQLAASFFFSRASGIDGRGEETNLMATLAHQLSQSVPATKPHIAAAVRENPLVFELALLDQIDALIIAPLIAVSDMTSGSERPKVIVVDGLDECREEHDAQRRVVDALISGLRRIPRHNFKLFITSRPEHNIVSIFKNYGEKLVRRIELDDGWNPDADIRIFLNAGFADIRRTHFYFESHPVDKTWPSPKTIDILVRRSSGQFIYASVVLKYIKSEENYSPVARLESILDVNNDNNQPYAELDALYEYIFSRVQNVNSVLTILSLEQLYDARHISRRSRPPLSTFLSEVLDVNVGLIGFWLRPLISLLVWTEERGICYMHASLPDFLVDESRSKIFCINSAAITTGIVRRVIGLFEDATAFKCTTSWTILLGIPFYFAGILPSDQKFQIYSLLSDFNVVEAAICKIDPDTFDTGDSVVALSIYLERVLKESEPTSDCREAFLKPVAQISTWLVNQLANFQSNDLAEKVDVWPFFRVGAQVPTLERGITSNTPTKQIIDILSSAVEICGSSICDQRLQRTKFDISHPPVFLRCLILKLTSLWLDRSDLLGRYAMTADRFGVALQCSAYYLLQLPKQVLLEILPRIHNPRRVAVVTPIIHLISQVLPTFLYRSPQTTDLYFLVALTAPVMRHIMSYSNSRFISNYLRQTVEKYPFLRDPTSSNYSQARAKVKEACINLKIKTSLHELAERGQTHFNLYGRESAGLEYKKLLAEFAIMDRRIPS